MKTILFLTLTFLIFGCAVSHKRGSDAQVTVDYYLENRGDMPIELTKMVSLKGIKEADVTVQWSVNDKGEPLNVSIQHDTLHNEQVNTLIIEHLKSMNFPKAPRFTTTTVEYTYKFQTTK
jgi:hypothetical protein